MKAFLVLICFIFCTLLETYAQEDRWVRVIDDQRGSLIPFGIVSDSELNVCTAGIFNSTIDFDPGSGIQDVTSVGFLDIFINKIDSNGSYQWNLTFGDQNEDILYGVEQDFEENLLSFGIFRDTITFQHGNSNALHLSKGIFDGFLAKFSVDGIYKWSLTFGGKSTDVAKGVSFGKDNSIYLAGLIEDTVVFNFLNGTIIAVTNSPKDFILKIDSVGNFQWLNTYDIRIGKIGADQFGQLYITGLLEDTMTLSTQNGDLFLSPKGPRDLLFARLDSLGNFQWIENIRSNQAISSTSFQNLNVDNRGNLYLHGSFFDTLSISNLPGKVLISNGNKDAFICKVDSNGNISWLKSFGGSKNDQITSMVLDDNSNIFLSAVVNDEVKFLNDNGVVKTFFNSLQSQNIIKFD